ncbi:hypothetical protein EJ07DRAFT_155018 [Lizonia empirigonia]|nr:hypothetical protein EJ07DRAFT_155018 [Lizonia empirigonia]
MVVHTAVTSPPLIFFVVFFIHVVILRVVLADSIGLHHTIPTPAHQQTHYKRRPRVKDKRLESPTSSGSPCQLMEIEDKGEYNEQRYDNVNTYWNSVMVEAGPEEKERRRLAEEDRKKRTRGRAFGDTKQLYEAVANRQRIRGSVQGTASAAAPERMGCLPPTPSTHRTPHSRTEGVTDQQSCFDRDTNGYRYSTPNENKNAYELPVDAQQRAKSTLTWNSALTRILASPCVDPSVSAAIRARARGRKMSRSRTNGEVDMRLVDMVPNFSYPLAGARWCERCSVHERPAAAASTTSDEQKKTPKPSNSPIIRPEQRPADLNINANSASNAPRPTTSQPSPSPSTDSLYRPPTPAHRTEHAPHSVLRDILDPPELAMYSHIATHDPRLSLLLEDADALQRQVPPVRNPRRRLACAGKIC